MKYTKGYLYQLAEDEYFQTRIRPKEHIITDFIELNIQGLLRGKRGYAWDGPSGPTKDRKTNMRASLGHDMIYQLLRLGLLDNKWREVADKHLAEWCKEDGMWKWWADHYYGEGCKDFAASAADPKNKKKVYEVP